jgi:spore germination protein GerM
VKRIVLAAVLLATAGCRGQAVTLVPLQDLPKDVYASPVPIAPASDAEIPEKGVVYVVQEGRLVAVTRPLSKAAPSLPAALLLALFQPSPEGEKGHSVIPTGTTLNRVTLVGSVALVDVSPPFETGGPERSLKLRVAQVVYTLTEPGTEISSVSFLIDGEARGVTAEGGQPLTGPVTRANYDRFGPRPA